MQGRRPSRAAPRITRQWKWTRFDLIVLPVTYVSMILVCRFARGDDWWPDAMAQAMVLTFLLWLLLRMITHTVIDLRRSRRIDEARCVKCGYPIGRAANCSECGHLHSGAELHNRPGGAD